MKIVEKIKMKQADLNAARPLTLAFCGDSVTHGCFELYPVNGELFGVRYDIDAVYHSRIREMLHVLYPSLAVNIINAGINGDSAPGCAERLERDVLSYKPDLVSVCFGLNDVGKGKARVNEYLYALRDIFTRCRENGAEVIFMTPNMIGTKTNSRVVDPGLKSICDGFCTPAMNDNMDFYMESARKLCAEMDVPVCDCYKIWKGMEAAGVDTTEMLCNDVNHPSREMHYIFAYELLKTMLS